MENFPVVHRFWRIVENLSTIFVENCQAFCLLFALWKLWKTYPQKLWISDIHRCFTARSVDKYFCVEPCAPILHIFQKLIHISNPFIHRLTCQSGEKSAPIYPPSVETVDKLSTKIVDKSQGWTYRSVIVIDSLSYKYNCQNDYFSAFIALVIFFAL